MRQIPSSTTLVLLVPLALFFAVTACGSSDPAAAGGAAGEDGGDARSLVDAQPDQGQADASSRDASLPPLPPQYATCASCMEMTCAPELAACNEDPTCRALVECALTSGCLQTDPSACVSTCASTLGLTPKEVTAQVKLLQGIATACTSCLMQCPRPDASIDASIDSGP
jgi:hypothetical protein